MAMNQTIVRKSGRRRKVSRKVAEAGAIDATQVFEDSLEPPQLLSLGNADVSSEESIFDVDPIDLESDDEDGEEEDDAMSLASASDSDELDPSADVAGAMDDDISDIAESDPAESPLSKPSIDRRRRPGVMRAADSQVPYVPVEEPHQSGIHILMKHAPKVAFFLHVNGCDAEEKQLYLALREKWLRELTLPSRTCDTHGYGGVAHSLLQSAESRQQDAVQSWMLYGRAETVSAFEQLQKIQILHGDMLAPYLPAAKALNYVLGGSDQIRPSTVHTNEVQDLNTVWSTSGVGSEGQVDDHVRKGWILNIGQSVHFLRWIPNQSGGDQYLSVTGRNEASLGEISMESLSLRTHSAFVPGEKTKSSIQIWRFASRAHATVSTIDNDLAPTLHMCLYFDYGILKCFSWCPFPEAQELHRSWQDSSLGILATIHGDGVLRVMKVPYTPSDLNKQQPRGHQFTNTAFEARPPGTIHTSLAWMSTSLLAAGCANGFVAVYDLDEHFSRKPVEVQAFPFIYQAFHDTFILSLTSCLPSRPYLLLSTAMDGHWRLTDVRDSTTDCAFTRRERFPPASAVWHEQTQGVLSADEMCNIRFAFARVAVNQQYVANVEASIRDIAVSPLHPSTLVGCADGSAYVMNPARIVLKGRVKADTENYRQAWFRHDWRRGRSQQERIQEAVDMSPREQVDSSELDFPDGISRLTSGLRLEELRRIREEADLMTHHTRAHYRPKDSGYVEGNNAPITIATIYERETAVNTLTWNPNKCAGGWAAAGMGDGLVLVEDLCWN